MKRSFPLMLVSLNDQGQTDEHSREITAEMFVIRISEDKKSADFVFVFQDGDNIYIHGREVDITGAANIFSRGHGWIATAAKAVGLNVGIRKEAGTCAFPGAVAAQLFCLLMGAVDETAAPWLSWE